LGVIAGTPEADGFMGDLGGGSLELTEIKDGKPGASVTLTVGSLRLLTASKGDRRTARDEVDRQLETVPWLGSMRGRTLYAVGGTWRAIARLDMELRDYPLHVIHGYTVSRKQMESLAQFVERLGRKTLSGITSVPRRRQETLPFGALALTRLLRLAKPKRVVFSSYGLREGFVFDRLDSNARRADPLFSGALRMAQRDSRFPDFGAALADWIAPLFTFESPAEQRLRLAACHLSDIGWTDHPDYRAVQAFLRVARSSLVGLDHPGRAFVACVVLARYGGEIDHPDVAKVLNLLDKDTIQRARAIGAALRLGYTVSAGSDSLLARTSLGRDRDEVRLRLPADGTVPVGEAVERHLESLVKILDAKQGRIG
jgi:exopolyphosphatase/guanosine-5'-triphosphate,3'-diphosphate pyrophosphatase